MIKTVALFLLLVSFTACIKIRSGKAKQDLQSGCIEVIRHCGGEENFSKVFCEDVSDLSEFEGVSAFNLGPDTKVVFHTEFNYEGEGVEFQESNECLADNGPWNDTFNSLQISHISTELANGCVKLILHCPGDENLSKIYCEDLQEIHDIDGVSGIELGPDTQVKVFESTNFEGESEIITENQSCLATSGPWNDRVNSIQIIRSG